MTQRHNSLFKCLYGFTSTAMIYLLIFHTFVQATDIQTGSAIPAVSPRKIVLLHLHDGAPFFTALGALSLSNKKRYCARHQYEIAYSIPNGVSGLWKKSHCNENRAIKGPVDLDSCIASDSSFRIDRRAPTFGKIKLTLAACATRPGYWVLWSDADALIVNQSVELESIIDDKYDIMLTVDWLMINAGVILFRCSDWTVAFLNRVYNARNFDTARALDQSAFQHFFDTEPDMDSHLKRIPKHALNVYGEEYIPGDFLVHMAGKLYEMTAAGATAVAHQYDMLSLIDEPDDVASFFNGRYFLNAYSGSCDITAEGSKNECLPEDERRIKLPESLLSMSYPNRYRHVGMRYYWLGDWKDIYDVDGWNDGRKVFDPSGKYHVSKENESSEASGDASHDEL